MYFLKSVYQQKCFVHKESITNVSMVINMTFMCNKYKHLDEFQAALAEIDPGLRMKVCRFTTKTQINKNAHAIRFIMCSSTWSCFINISHCVHHMNTSLIFTPTVSHKSILLSPSLLCTRQRWSSCSPHVPAPLIFQSPLLNIRKVINDCVCSVDTETDFPTSVTRKDSMKRSEIK